MPSVGKTTRAVPLSARARCATRVYSSFATTRDSVKILYVSQYYPPEMGAPAARASELAFHWARMGHEVTILTGFPNHPTGKIHADYRGKLRRIVIRENMGGVKVVRTWLLPFANQRSLRRMANYAS